MGHLIPFCKFLFLQVRWFSIKHIAVTKENTLERAMINRKHDSGTIRREGNKLHWFNSSLQQSDCPTEHPLQVAESFN